MQGLARYESGICECGFHESLTTDKSNIFRPGFRVCPVCAGSAQYWRMHGEVDAATAKSDPNMPAKAPRPSDGRHVFMQLVSDAETTSTDVPATPA